jgi:hypothetical protein
MTRCTRSSLAGSSTLRPATPGASQHASVQLGPRSRLLPLLHCCAAYEETLAKVGIHDHGIG